MCKYESAVKFLDAIRFILNDAFVRCTYLNTPKCVFATDSQEKKMILLKLNQTFRGGFVSLISEIKDFMLSLADSYDTEL